VEAWRELVKTEAVERDSVEPVKGVPPGVAPFIEDTLREKLESVRKRPIPPTSKLILLVILLTLIPIFI
jgi:hypothetical protein